MYGPLIDNDVVPISSHKATWEKKGCHIYSIQQKLAAKMIGFHSNFKKMLFYNGGFPEQYIL